MSDEQLRELERRFRSSGSVEDEAAWLRARVQAGELSDERLWLAAYVGHSAAVEVFYANETQQAWVPTTFEQVDCWIRGLEQWGQTTLVRAAVSVATAMLSGDAERPEFRFALWRAESWVLSPTLRNALRANSAIPDAGEVTLVAFDCHEKGREPTEDDPGAFVFWVGALVTAAVGVCHWCVGRHAAWTASWPAESVERGDQFEEVRPAVKIGRAVARASRLGDLAAVVKAVQNELASFALGYSDPVCERVEARRREAAGE